MTGPQQTSHIEPIMNEFPNIETFVACSAKDLSNVSEVFHYAQKAVLHPSSPLFIYEINELTITVVKALHRIFRLCDLDNDGYLSDNEINYLQVKAFGAPLDKINLIEIKQLIGYNCVDGLCHDCGTESGFVCLNNLFIQQERIETAWTILRSFGYADDLSLRSDLVQPQFTLQSGCSVELSSVGIQFFISLPQTRQRSRRFSVPPRNGGPVWWVSPLQPLGHGRSAECHNQLQMLDRLSWIPVPVEHDSLPRHSRFLEYLAYLHAIRPISILPKCTSSF